jgi:hypothetical protein
MLVVVERADIEARAPERRANANQMPLTATIPVQPMITSIGLGRGSHQAWIR